MFSCNDCDKCFTRKDILRRHQQDYCKPISNLCEICGTIFSSQGHFRKHQLQKHGLHKRKLSDNDVAAFRSPKKTCPVTEHHNEIEIKEDFTRCEACEIDIPRKYINQHNRSLKHKNKTCVVKGGGISLIKQTFKNRIATYRVTTDDEKLYINVKEFMNVLKPKVYDCILSILNKHGAVKVNVELFGLFVLESKGLKEVKSFNTKFVICNASTDIDHIYKNFTDDVDNKISEFQERESGWVLEKLLFSELNINKYNPLKASSYIPLPKFIASKKAVVNIQNSDDKCFMWSVLAAIHPAKYNPERVTNYIKYENELNFEGMEFPVKLKEISKFEKMNNISVNVYGLETIYKNSKINYEIAGPMHFTEKRLEKHVNLLLIDDRNGNNHYCLIKDLSRLVGKYFSKHKAKKFLCDGCLIYFSKEKRLESHQLNDCNHIRVNLPSTEPRIDKFGNVVPGNILKFESFQQKLKVPFVVYADFESLLSPIQYCQKSNEDPFTEKTHLHVPYSFAYYIKCDYDETLSKLEIYRGTDCAEVFCERLEEDVKIIYNNYLKHEIPMNPLTEIEQLTHNLAKKCHICEKPFTEGQERVHDHCHLTGNYRGPAHSVCNLNFKLPNYIPVFFHNLTGYDTHLFIKQLALEKEHISVIAENKEKYISFSKHVLVDTIQNPGGFNKNIYMPIRFLDSFRFMPMSLDKLSTNLSNEQLITLKKHFGTCDKFELMRRKGVFPYSYADSFKKLEEDKLPSMAQFYDTLNGEHISQSDYDRAVRVWNLFECKNLGDYSDIYLKSDVLLLADVFTAFRDVCKKVYDLDPCQFFTAPGLSWAAMLKCTAVELELLTDIDMIHFIRRGIRGGVSQCSKRYVQANNKYMSIYDESKPVSFINYLDATNLYGKSLSAFLPINSFKFLTPEEIEKLDIPNISEKSTTGFILEVDLQYPENIHDEHNELPFCPENIVPPNSKQAKLILNLNDKTKYVLHYRNLQQCLRAGLKLVKIHRVLSFSQSPWLKGYIDLNTQMRNVDKTEFGKMFFKLMNNSVFGKTMENVDKRTDIRLVTHWENVGRRAGAEALIAKPHFNDRAIFTENLVAIHMAKLQVKYDKPIYIGFCVLDLAKHIIYDFYYNFIKKIYGDRATLAYTDTDSLILETFTEDFYKDIKNHLDKYDTSNFKENNQFGIPRNESVVGKMKDEYAGRILWEFVGTGAKAYVVNVEGELSKTAKGIQKAVIKKELTLEDYKNVVLNKVNIYKNVRSFRSYNHQLYTELKNKVALSWRDDKRYINPDSSGSTMAWGHYKIADLPFSSLNECT